MKENEKADFFSLLQGVYDFYRQDTSTFAAGIWWRAMQPYDLPAIADAMSRYCINPDEGRYMPKPADIVRMLAGSMQDAALRAWSIVDRAVREIGPWCSVAFDDQIIHRCLTDMGGWIALGQKTEAEWPFVKNEFLTRHRGYLMRAEKPAYPPILIGIADAENKDRDGGRSSNPPQHVLLIGDAQAAQSVIAGGSDIPPLAVTQYAIRDTGTGRYQITQ